MLLPVRDFDDKQKEIFIEALTFMLTMDKNAAKEKHEFLKIQAVKCGFDLRKLKSKSNKKPTEIASMLSKIDNIALRRYILLQMIMLTIASHELSDTEVDTIYAIGTKAGISMDKIDDFFLWAAKGVEWQVEGAKMLEEDL